MSAVATARFPTPKAGSRITVSRVAATAACVLGAMVFAGWASGIDVLTSLSARYISMLPVTALGMVAAGIAILIMSGRPGRMLLVVARTLAVLIGALGVASLMSRLAGRDLFWLGALFYDQLVEHPYRPVGVMATNSTVAFMLASMGLLLVSSDIARRRHMGRLLAAIGAAIALVALLGHLYGARILFAIDRAAGMALMTALAFAAVHLGIMFLRPGDAGVSLITGGDLAGRVTRRLLPLSVAFPVLLGVLWLSGRELSWFSRETGIALFVALTVIWVITISLYNAHLIRMSDAQRNDLFEREQEARATAESASQAKTDFLAVMSHELRTPLNAIVGYTDLMAQGIPGPVTEEQLRLFVRIRGSAHHLTRIVEDILTLTRLDVGTIDLQRSRVHLPALFTEVCDMLEPLAQAKSLQFDCESDDAYFDTDVHRLRQILVNLGGNAVKFTVRGGVRIVGRMYGDDGDATLVAEISDTGMGIAPENLDRIFEDFWQAEHPLKREHGGTGLGLAVSRRLARAMGGDITVESRPAEGSTFTLRLPALKASGVRSTGEFTARRSSAPRDEPAPTA